MSQNPQHNDKFISEVICSLSSDERYFIAYYDPKGYFKADFSKLKPYFIVYRQENIKIMKDLMDMFAEEHIQFDKLQNGMVWELRNGVKISPNMTLEELKKGLRTEKIDGLKLFVYQKSGQLSDQSGVMTYLNKCHEYSLNTYQAQFFIEGAEFYINLPLTPKTKINDAKSFLQKEIQRNLSAYVEVIDIEIFFSKQGIIYPAQNNHLSQYIGDHKQKFIVKFSNKVCLKSPPKQNNTFITIKGEGVQEKKLSYDSIKDRKLINVLDQLIPKKETGLKKKALILQGQLLRLNQSFSKFENIFKNSSVETKYFIGYLIDECLTFNLQYTQLFAQGPINFQKIVLRQQSNLRKRREYEQFSQKKAKTTTLPHFKDTNHVLTIAYYTSQLNVLGSDSKESGTIYFNLNRFMRENDFCNAELLSMEDHWEYRFAAHLYHQLRQIKPFENKTLWRGINYKHSYKKGANIYFQQFSSTSLEKKSALDFASKGLFIITNSKSAHPIKQFSVFPNQNQAIVQPYTTWNIINIWKLSKQTIIQKKQSELLSLNEQTYAQWIKNSKDQKNQEIIDLIIVKEIEKPKLPEMNSTVFLWVDDKTGEGKDIWSQIQEIKNSTVMIQLLTTAQLENWLKNHKQMIQDPQIEIVMITNMTRVQAGKEEGKAGVYAIDAFYKHKPKGTVFVYIGWLQGTLNKLKEHKYFPSKNLIVSDQLEDMVNFLKEKGFKSK